MTKPTLLTKAALLAAVSLTVGALPFSTNAQGQVELELQKSKSPDNGFDPVELAPGNIDGGKIVLSDGDPTQEFYRLEINIGDGSEFLEVLPAEKFPEASRRALTFLREYVFEDQSEENPWRNATIAQTVVPYYNPAVGRGREPAYLEFSIVPGPSTPAVGAAAANNDYGKSDNDQPAKGLGYLVLSLSEQDFPVAIFATEGKPVSRYFIDTCQSRRFNIVYYDESFIVAESKDGEQSMAFLGSEPIMLPDALLKLPHHNDREATSEKPVDDPQDPGLEGQPYPSYQSFKKDYLTSPVFEQIRRNRAEYARIPWAIEQGEEAIDKLTKKFPIGENPVPIIGERNRPVEAFDFDSEDEAFQAELFLKGGIVFGSSQRPGGGLLTVRYADGELGTCPVVFFDKQAVQAQACFGWEGWHSWSITGTTPAIGQYGPPVTGCSASGCGPTAWAILYGWWDLNGRPRMLGANWADTPMSGGSGAIIDCIQWTFNRMGTFCILNQAGTWPNKMHRGRYWANEQRGYGYWYWYSYAYVPFVNSGCWKKVRDGIKHDRDPGILGIGFLEHYVVADRYKYRKYKVFCGTTYIQRRFRSNWGRWSGSRYWHNAYNTFFGIRMRVN